MTLGPLSIFILCTLADADRPLSYTEVVNCLKDNGYDPATIYRNLIKLKEAGITSIASRVDGVNRYALIAADRDGHRHPHFICDDCGDISCLPEELTASMHLEGPWSTAIKLAQVQLRGECPACIDSK